MTKEFKKITNKSETRYILEDASASSTSANTIATAPRRLGELQKRLQELKDKVPQKPRQGPLRPQTGAGVHKNKKKDQQRGLEKHKGQSVYQEEFNGEYDDEAGMVKNNIHTIVRVMSHLEREIADNENLPEWVQEKIASAKGMLVGVMDYMISQHEMGVAPEQGVAEGRLADEARNKSPYDCGGADRHYGLKYNPHKVVNWEEEYSLTTAEKDQYKEGWQNELDRKNYRESVAETSVGVRPSQFNPEEDFEDFKYFVRNNYPGAAESIRLMYGHDTPGSQIKQVAKGILAYAKLNPNMVDSDMHHALEELEGLLTQDVAEGGKKKGADGKACWKGYRYAGTKNGKDSCVKVGEDTYTEHLLSQLQEKFASQQQAKKVKKK
jgi:hypothetical protein